MSEFCSVYAQECKSACCDRYGDCPEYSGSHCYYFYNKASRSWTNEKVLFYLMIGLGVSLIIFLLWCCLKKSKNTGAWGQGELNPGTVNYGGQQGLQGQQLINQQINPQFNQQIPAPPVFQAQQYNHGIGGNHFVGEMTPAGPIAGEITASTPSHTHIQDQNYGFGAGIGGSQLGQGGQFGQGNQGTQFRSTTSAIVSP